MEYTDKQLAVAANQVATLFGFDNGLYGEWLLVGNEGPRPCRLSNWSTDDLVSFVGGEYAKTYRKAKD